MANSCIDLFISSDNFDDFIVFCKCTILQKSREKKLKISVHLQIPDSPQWLLSKNRAKDAQKSLCWLRGWVPIETVAHEFYDLQRHSERSKSCNSCVQRNLQCSHPLPSLAEKFAELKRKRAIKPFAIVITLFFLSQFTGILCMRAFMVQVLKAYDCPIQLDQAASIMSYFDNFGNVVYMLVY